ncbi:MAG: hybrid sensor histidine kinase/response regulator [Campylobacterota bacterium]|nr:hybrid sensor histidine kinase/response regulator [Campylobacterota bacterium]
MLFSLNEILVIGTIEALLLFVGLFVYFKMKPKNQSGKIDDFESEIESLKKELADKSSSKKSSEIDITKTSFIGSQIQKVETLEIALEKQKERVEDIKLIAQQANMIKHNFLENVKHEIYTPLNTIVTNTESLGKSLKDKKQLDFAKNIYNSSHQLSALFEKIITLSELELNTFDVSESAVDLRGLLEERVQKYRALAKKKKLDLTLNVDEDIPNRLMLSESIIQEISDNLIHNAIKFTQSGYVKVRVLSNGFDKAKNAINFSIIVEDSGVGIKKENQSKIFEIFEKLDDRDTQIMGLGLSVNKKMADSINATLQVQSQISQGSTFALFFNQVEVFLSNEQDNIFNPLVDFSLIRPDGASVMVIDEENSSGKTIVENFQDTAVEVDVFSNTREAIKNLQNKKFDMIFIDIDMLSVDESAVSKVIANISRAPVVTLTSVRLKDIDFIEGGVKPVGHLKKPISRFELFKISLEVLDSKSVKILSDGTLKIK